MLNGFLHTQDLPHFNAQGWYFLGGRTDDVINPGAEKLSLLEVEEVLRRARGVLDVPASACAPAFRRGAGGVRGGLGQGPRRNWQWPWIYCLGALERWKRPRMYARVSEIPRTMPKRTKDMGALRQLVRASACRIPSGSRHWGTRSPATARASRAAAPAYEERS